MHLEIAKLAVHSIPVFSMFWLSLGIPLMFGWLALTTSSSQGAYEGCVWRGTAPLCEGSCNPGETTLTTGRTGSVANTFVRGQFGINPPDFGEGCFSGVKSLCCRQVADPVPQQCPEGQIRRNGKCQEVGVLPGSTTGEKGGAVQIIPPCPEGKKWSDSEKACVFTTYKKMGRNNTVCAKNDVDIYNSPTEPRQVTGLMNGGTKGTIVQRHPDGWSQIQGLGWIAQDHLGPCP
jgi:hypothetical protein